MMLQTTQQQLLMEEEVGIQLRLIVLHYQKLQDLEEANQAELHGGVAVVVAVLVK